jgi:hypothetical protein
MALWSTEVSAPGHLSQPAPPLRRLLAHGGGVAPRLQCSGGYDVHSSTAVMSSSILMCYAEVAPVACILRCMQAVPARPAGLGRAQGPGQEGRGQQLRS